jgi:Ca-activated chloride channel homolog
MKRGLRAVFAVLLALLFATLGVLALFANRLSSLRALEFQFPLRLLLLPLALIALVVFILRGNEPRVHFGSVRFVRELGGGIKRALADVPLALRAAAIMLCIVAFARPQNAVSADPNEEQGIDIVVALDLSNSMMAIMEDDAPKRLTRLETAKQVLIDFIGKRPHDRIGVIVFGRAAFVLSPPTLDRLVLQNLVSKMDLNLIDGAGTAIGEGVGASVARLHKSQSASKVVILLTDGDSNAGSITPEYAIQLAKKETARIYTVQLGNGDWVDVQQGVGLDGQPFYTKQKFPVNPVLLQQMAKETGGEAFIANDRRALEASIHTILNDLERTKLESTTRPMDELFAWFAFGALVLLLLEAILAATWLQRFS